MGNPNNIFTDKESFRTIDQRRLVYLFISIFAFVITEVGRDIYRPFIYANDINDMGIADSIGNLGGIFVQIFLALAILNSPLKKGIRLILFFTIGYIVYEFIQPILPRGVFDWNDILGTVIGGFLGMVLFLLINKIITKNNILHRF